MKDPLAVLGELRGAIRRLLRRPSFAVTVVAMIAIGIGANTTIFSVVRSVLLQSLALPEADHVVELWSTRPARGEARDGVSRQDADDWRAQNHVFGALGTYVPQEGNIVVNREPARLVYALASADVFRALAVPAAMGRVLTREDDRSEKGDVAVVSHGFWVRVLGADPAVVGRAVSIDGRPLTIVGVMPASFSFPSSETVLWTPFSGPPDATGPRIARWVYAVARLAPGATLLSAQREMSTIAARLATQFPTSNAGVGVLVETEQAAITEGVRSLLLVAWAAVGIVLLIVATNVINLFLTQAAAHEAETSVRTALGATRWSLLQQYLTESVLLSVSGGVAGLSLAWLATPAWRTLEQIGVPRTDRLGLDMWVVAYGLGLALVVGLVCGVIPVLSSGIAAPSQLLRKTAAGMIGSSHERLRVALSISQVALAVVVLIGAGLLIRSFGRLSGVDPGFSARSGLVFRIAPDQQTYRDKAHAVALYGALEQRLGTLPGVVSVGAVNRAPLTGAWWTTDYQPEGTAYPPGQAPTASYRVATPGYLHTLGIPLIHGRWLEARDNEQALRVVVVSRGFADHAWPHSDPIGRRVSFDPNAVPQTWYVVVGVVGDVHTNGLDEAPEALAYVSLPQAKYGFFGDWGMDVVLRTSPEASGSTEAARHVVQQLAPTVPLYQARPLDALVARDLARRRALMVLMSTFAATAILLAAVGLFAIVAYGVAQRRREIGLRLALGADASRVRSQVIARGLAVAAIGAAVGLLASMAGSRLLASQLYGVAPGDAMTYFAVTIMSLAIAFAAAWLPARRASSIDPIIALRHNP